MVSHRSESGDLDAFLAAAVAHGSMRDNRTVTTSLGTRSMYSTRPVKPLLHPPTRPFTPHTGLRIIIAPPTLTLTMAMGQHHRTFGRRVRDTNTSAQYRSSHQAGFRQRVETPRSIGAKPVTLASSRSKDFEDTTRTCIFRDVCVLIAGTLDGHRDASTYLGNILRRST